MHGFYVLGKAGLLESKPYDPVIEGFLKSSEILYFQDRLIAVDCVTFIPVFCKF